MFTAATFPGASWLFLACAVLVAPRLGSRAASRPVPPQTSAAGGVPRRAFGAPFAVVALGAACVAVLGVTEGALAALVACPLAWTALQYLLRRPVPEPVDPALPVTLDLVAAALRSGRPLADALKSSAPAARADVAAELCRVAGLLRLGEDPAQAWTAVPRDGPLVAVAAVAIRSAASGIKIAAAFERQAGELRAERTAASSMRANRAGVVALAPLAACYLPSFVCLGVVPVVVGIAQSALGVLPG